MLNHKVNAALMIAADEQHPITDLEYLQYPQRNINMLEGAGIHTMDQLLNKKPEDLMSISNFGVKAMSELQRCLGIYDQIDEIKDSFDNEIRLRRQEYRTVPVNSEA